VTLLDPPFLGCLLSTTWINIVSNLKNKMSSSIVDSWKYDNNFIIKT